jgi:hypothetical protein
MEYQKMRHRVIVFAGILALGIVTNAEAAMRDDARGECTLATLNGTYGFTGTGTIVGLGPVANVGTIAFDGNGTVSIEVTQSLDGQIARRSFVGVYWVNSNCTAAADFSGATQDIVILAEGEELMWIRTNPGLVVTATAKKQARHRKDDDGR